MKFKVFIVSLVVVLLVLTAAAPLPAVSAAEAAQPTPPGQSGETSVEVVNDYYSIIHTTTRDGIALQADVINGPPAPPDRAAWEATRMSLSDLDRAANTLAGFPSYSWVYGCSAVSGAMIAGYYDNHGYPNLYAGPTNGGVMPLTDTSWPTWTDGFRSYPNNPLVASHDGLDGRVGRGSIDDYWYYYESEVDPYITYSWPEHTWGTAIGDFMKTSQYNNYGNIDGGTRFYYYNSPAPLTCSSMASAGIAENDGTYGRKLFYEARGYSVTDCFYQRTDNLYPGGFSLADFQAEIDAGHPVFISLAGHSVVGYGYSDSTIYIRDTWDSNPASLHTMTWGGSYQGMAMLSVSIVRLAEPTTPPGSFGKSSPANGAADQSLTPTLAWGSSAGANSYEYCIDDNPDGTCSNWTSTGLNTAVQAAGLSADTTYYWQARAVNGLETTYADGAEAAEWTFTTYDPASLTEKNFLPLILN